MFNTPFTPQSIKAETAYRQERTKRDFRSLTRRARTERHEPQHARRAVRYTTAA